MFDPNGCNDITWQVFKDQPPTQGAEYTFGNGYEHPPASGRVPKSRLHGLLQQMFTTGVNNTTILQTCT
jgi:hypothetical protein